MSAENIEYPKRIELDINALHVFLTLQGESAETATATIKRFLDTVISHLPQ